MLLDYLFESCGSLSLQHGNDEQSFAGDCVVMPDGLVLAVCDEASHFNRPSVFTELWQAAANASTDRLFVFNSYLAREMSAGNACCWILVLWGVFRLRVKVHARIDQMPPLEICNDLFCDSREATILLPSGRLGLLDLECAASKPWRLVATIAPGKYAFRLVGDENPDHWNLAGPEQYPSADCDWVLHVCWLGPATPNVGG